MTSFTIDKEFEIPVFSPICTTCRHLDLDAARNCAAFPDGEGIPLVIWNGENDHRSPFPGDHGVRYEQFQTGFRSWDG